MAGIDYFKDRVGSRKANTSIEVKHIGVDENLKTTIGKLPLAQLVSRGIIRTQGNGITVDLEQLTAEEKHQRGVNARDSSAIIQSNNSFADFLMSNYGLTSATLTLVSGAYPDARLSNLMTRYLVHKDMTNKIRSVVPETMFSKDDEHLLNFADQVEYATKYEHLAFIAQQLNKLSDTNYFETYKANHPDFILDGTNFPTSRIYDNLNLVTDANGIPARTWLTNTFMPRLAAANAAEVPVLMNGYFKVLATTFMRRADAPHQPTLTLTDTTGQTQIIEYSGFEYGTHGGTSLFERSLAGFFHDPTI